MSNDLTTTMPDAATMESLIIGGDLSKLTPAQRVSYYTGVCKSVGLNPMTKPFDYIVLNGKMILYANKGCADQLRDNNAISIDKPDIQFVDDWIIVTVVARNGKGRTDSDIGAVNKKDMRGDFGNALMKAVTKAKRRVTLSICGLGMLDETEVETIPTAQPVKVAETGEIVDGKATEVPGNGKPAEKPWVMPNFPSDLPEMSYETASEYMTTGNKSHPPIPYIKVPSSELVYHAGSLLNTWRTNEAAALKLSAIAAILHKRDKERADKAFYGQSENA